MNSRGKLPQPDSVRGLAGSNNAPAEFVQETLIAPAWLKEKRHRVFFVEIVEKQRAAGVGLRQVDAEIYAQYAVLAFDFREADSAEDRQRARRVLTALEDQLVIGERARQRVGIRGKKAAPKGKLAVMLANKANGTTGGG